MAATPGGLFHRRVQRLW